MTRMLALLAVCLLALGACSSLPTAEEAGGVGIYTVSVEQAADRFNTVEGLVILDVRTADEYDAGHLPGAINIDFYADDFEERIAALDRDTPYLIHCAVGGRSGSAGTIMSDLGFTDVADMTDGFAAWQRGGFPVEG